MDTFRIVLKEEPKLCVKQTDSQDCLGCLFYLSSDTEHLTILIHRKFGDKTLKSHDIISNKTSKVKWKNTYKKASLQPTENQLVMKSYKKRCLVRVQKGVSKTSKGHLLQVNQASFQSQKITYRF